jgi:hypothetical protein
MTQRSAEELAQLASLSELVPGLGFEYKVRAEKGGFGDFPGRFPFAVHDEWLVEAKIIGEVGLGHEAAFDVFADGSKTELLMNGVGVIQPRPSREHPAVQSYAAGVVHEDLATIIDPFTINFTARDQQGPEKASKCFLIPGRNIQPGTLRIIGVTARG